MTVQSVHPEGQMPSIPGAPYVDATGKGKAVDPSIAPSMGMKDTVEGTKGMGKRLGIPPDISADQPKLDPVDQTKVTGAGLATAVQFLAKNPWLIPSFLAALFSIMNYLAKQQSLMHFDEAQAELVVRDQLFKLAKESGSLARALSESQAREQFVQATMAFVNAGVSAVSFVEYSRNYGAAKREAEDEITKQREATEKLKPIAVADNQGNLTTPPDPPEYTAAKQKLESMEANVNQTIHQKMTRKDEQTRSLTEMYKQVVNGVQATLLATIKLKSGVIEAAQKILDGFIQLFMKYQESSARARDNAGSAVGKIFDDFNRTMDKSSHATTGPG